MDDDFHSLNKGVFVIPFQPRDGEPGPSKLPRSLVEVYDDTYARHETAHKDYEEDLTAEQLDEIEGWLERCAAPPLLKRAFPIHRLQLAVIQNLSPYVAPLLPSLKITAATVNSRDMTDLASATRAVAVAFLGEAALAAKKAGRTPLDEVERWWRGLRNTPPLLLHVQEAQVVPAAVLSELIYILNLHSEIPIRLLLSVPSINVFMSGWTLLEPSEVDLSILSVGRSRKRSAGVHTVLKAASNPGTVPICITRSVADELEAEEELFGGGPLATLKSLKWLLLHHSHTSPLVSIAEDMSSDTLAKVQTLINEVQQGEVDDVAAGMFTVDAEPDLVSVLNPAPRLSILQAMAKPATFLSGSPQPDGSTREGSSATTSEESRHSGVLLSEDEQQHVTNGDTLGAPPNGVAFEGFKDIEALYQLWQSAGKSVNLWDWLEGFRAMVDDDDDEEGEEDEAGEADENGADATRSNGKRKRSALSDAGRDDDKAEKEARQHATFIRFVEESRMMGLVRARGSRTSKRADEVVKGVTMI